MPHLLVFGLGYTASRLAERLRGEGWRVTGTRRAAAHDAIAFDDASAVRAAIASASHILSSVPPAEDRDPVLAAYRADIAAAPARWIGYLSSTGVYGDTGGAWVDETAPYGGRRTARAEADRAWLAVRPETRAFRLPGIYGPGRSPIDRARSGAAHRIDLPGQVFSRCHVDDIVAGLRSHRVPYGLPVTPATLRRWIGAGAAMLYTHIDDFLDAERDAFAISVGAPA